MTAASSRPASGRRSPLSAFTSEETLEFLNEELNLLGIQTIDRLPTTASTTTATKFRVGAGDDAVGVDESVEQLLRTLFHLVDLQRRNVVAINDLETDKRTFRSEKERLSRQLQQLQQQQAAMKQTTAQAKEKERRAEVKAKELTKMLNAERDEKKKLFQVSCTDFKLDFLIFWTKDEYILYLLCRGGWGKSGQGQIGPLVDVDVTPGVTD